MKRPAGSMIIAVPYTTSERAVHERTRQEVTVMIQLKSPIFRSNLAQMLV